MQSNKSLTLFVQEGMQIVYRYCFLVTLLAGGFCNGQIPNGMYVSDQSSHRADFIMQIKDGAGKHFGWEVTPRGDTVYYSAKFKIKEHKDKVLSMRLKGFKFSSKPYSTFGTPLISKVQKVRIDGLMLYTEFEGLNVDGILRMNGNKDTYDEQSDAFYFNLRPATAISDGNP